MLRRVPALYATLFALLLSPAVAHAQIAESRTQPGRLEVTFTDRTATGAAGWLDVSKYGIVDHALSFTVFGAPSAVSVSLGCSNDGGLTSTSTVGTSTSTTGGTISTTALVCTHVRMVVNTLTGGTSPKIRGVYTGTGSGANATVSGDITATITGFATDAKQDTQTTELTAIKTATQAVSALITGGAIPVTGSFTSGGLTDTQLRATPVPVSGTIGISQTTTANDVDATITNSTLAVTQSGNWTARLADGSGNAIGSNANGGSTRGLAAVIYDGSGNVVSSFGGSGGTASAFGSAFPSGASSGTASGFYDGTNMQAARVFDLDSGGGTQYGLGINLRRAASGGSAELIGQATMANSLPVALASDQTALPITDNSGSLTIEIGRAHV